MVEDRDNHRDAPTELDWWDIANTVRQAGPVTLQRLVLAARDAGYAVSWEDALGIPVGYQGRETGQFLVPRFVVDFLASYAARRGFEHVFDPNAGSGVLLTALVATGGAKQGTGVLSDPELLPVAEHLSAGLPITWHLSGSLPSSTPPLTGPFDAVVSFPPLIARTRTETFQTQSGLVTVRDTDTHLHLLRWLSSVGETGEAVFVLPDDSLSSRAYPDSVLAQLATFGFHLNAVVALGDVSFGPWNWLPWNILFISRQSTDHLFIGRLTPNQDQASLLENLCAHRPGRIPALGALVTAKQFTSWRTFELDQEIQRGASKAGLSPVPFKELALAINLGDRSENGGFADQPNSIYLPLIGLGPVVTSPSEITGKPHNYAQIVLRPDRVLASYMAPSFSTSLGKKIRQRWMLGRIRRLSKQALREMVVYVPGLEIQDQVVEVSQSIRELHVRLQELHRDLWNQPNSVRRIRRELTRINHGDRLDTWVRPLASILRRYLASADADDKLEYLFFFFEATAMFASTVMLSAFESNPEVCTHYRHRWQEIAPERQLDWTRSSFGNWVVLGKRLAKITRELNGKSETRTLALSLYKTTDDTLIRALTSKELFAALEQAGRLRNEWKGHSGATSEKERSRRLRILEELLVNVHTALDGAFDEWLLFKPLTAWFEAGVHYYTVHRLMGSDTIFDEIKDVGTVTPLSKSRLYLAQVTREVIEPLELKPFLKIRPSPRTEQNACYFYNRVVSEGVRWVSYHFAGEPEFVEPDPELLVLIQSLQGAIRN